MSAKSKAGIFCGSILTVKAHREKTARLPIIDLK